MQKQVTLNIQKDTGSNWTFRSTDANGETTVWDIDVRIANEHDSTYDVNGRQATVKLYVQVCQQDVERPAFISTRGTLVINRLHDGEMFDCEATLDFGKFETIGETAVIGKTRRGTAEAFASQVAQDFVAKMRRDRKAVAK